MKSDIQELPKTRQQKYQVQQSQSDIQELPQNPEQSQRNPSTAHQKIRLIQAQKEQVQNVTESEPQPEEITSINSFAQSIIGRKKMYETHLPNQDKLSAQGDNITQSMHEDMAKHAVQHSSSRKKPSIKIVSTKPDNLKQETQTEREQKVVETESLWTLEEDYSEYCGDLTQSAIIGINEEDAKRAKFKKLQQPEVHSQDDAQESQKFLPLQGMLDPMKTMNLGNFCKIDPIVQKQEDVPNKQLSHQESNEDIPDREQKKQHEDEDEDDDCGSYELGDMTQSMIIRHDNQPSMQSPVRMDEQFNYDDEVGY